MNNINLENYTQVHVLPRDARSKIKSGDMVLFEKIKPSFPEIKVGDFIVWGRSPGRGATSYIKAHTLTENFLQVIRVRDRTLKRFIHYRDGIEIWRAGK